MPKIKKVGLCEDCKKTEGRLIKNFRSLEISGYGDGEVRYLCQDCLSRRAEDL